VTTAMNRSKRMGVEDLDREGILIGFNVGDANKTGLPVGGLTFGFNVGDDGKIGLPVVTTILGLDVGDDGKIGLFDGETGRVVGDTKTIGFAVERTVLGRIVGADVGNCCTIGLAVSDAETTGFVVDTITFLMVGTRVAAVLLGSRDALSTEVGEGVNTIDGV